MQSNQQFAKLSNKNYGNLVQIKMHITLFFTTLTIYEVLCMENEEWKIFPSSSTSAYTNHSNITEIDLQLVLLNCQNCLTFIKLYQNVNLLPSSTPLIIGRHLPVQNDQGLPYFVPADLATNVEKKGLLTISKNQSDFCVSKFFDIKNTICTNILLANFTMRIRPWSFEQYTYLLPSLKYYEMHRLWQRSDESNLEHIPNNILGVMVSELQLTLLRSFVILYRPLWALYQP